MRPDIKLFSVYLFNTNKSITFALFNLMITTMKTKKLSLSEIEFDLIEAGRNYKKAYPNGSIELRYYVERLFVKWLDGED